MATPRSGRAALKEATVKAGSAAALGRILGVTRQAISKAVKKGFAPLGWCKIIEDKFGIERARLRPDIFG